MRYRVNVLDLHSHAVTEGYLKFIKQHHAEMDEGFPILAEPLPEAAKRSLAARLPLHNIDPQTVFSDNARRLFGEEIPVRKQGDREIYADSAAYQSHIQTPHFKKYKEGTAAMVRSLKLIDVNPLVVPRGLVKP